MPLYFFINLVYTARNQQCRSPEKISVSKHPTFLMSTLSMETSCGLHGSPWIIEALPGQHIDIHIIDFSWKNGSFELNSCPVNYGYILDMESDDVISICGGSQRRKSLYYSIGHTVQIILERNVLDSSTFMLQFLGNGLFVLHNYKFLIL